MSAAVGEGGMKVQSGENGVQGEYCQELIHVPKSKRP